MLDLGPGADILRGLGWLYIGLIVLLVGASLWFPERWWQKVVGVAVVLLVFTGPAYLRNRERGRIVDKNKARYEAAKALFDERCKTAEEKIEKTVSNVDGILLKTRPRTTGHSNQFNLDDPYGKNCEGDACISLYLFDYKMVPAGNAPSSGLVPHTPRLYQYVDADDQEGGKRYRYTKASPNSPLVKSSPGIAPRYEVVWDDISTKEDRQHWIAGGSLKVVDLLTKEVIAERRGYLMDPGQGSIAGNRNPWDWARSYSKGCPAVADHNQSFVLKVLKPKQGVDDGK